MAPLLAPSSAKIRSARSPRRTRSADPISQAVWSSLPDGGTAEFLPHQFQIFHFVGATLASFEMSSQAGEPRTLFPVFSDHLKRIGLSCAAAISASDQTRGS
jgi:hypothetical protein